MPFFNKHSISLTRFIQIFPKKFLRPGSKAPPPVLVLHTRYAYCVTNWITLVMSNFFGLFLFRHYNAASVLELKGAALQHQALVAAWLQQGLLVLSTACQESKVDVLLVLTNCAESCALLMCKLNLGHGIETPHSIPVNHHSVVHVSANR